MFLKTLSFLSVFVAASFYSVFSLVMKVESSVELKRPQIQEELTHQLETYLNAKSLKEDSPAVMAKRHIATQESSLPEEHLNMPLLIVENPILNPFETTFVPAGILPLNQTQIDSYYKRLQLIRNVPSDYYRTRLLDHFRDEIERELIQESALKIRKVILEEIHQLRSQKDE